MNDDTEFDQTLRDAVRSYGLKQQLSAIHREMIPEVRVRKMQPSPLRQIGRASMKVAAGLLFIVFSGLLYLYISTSGENLFNSKYATYSNTVRGSENNSTVKSYFLAGQNALRSGNADLAIRQFQQVLSLNQASGGRAYQDDAQYYLALSYLKKGEAGKALAIFQTIHDTKDHFYNDRVSGWFLFRVKLLSYKQ